MRRAQLFIALCAVCVLAATAYLLFAANRREQQLQQQQVQVAADAPASPGALAAVMARQNVVYLYSPTGYQYRMVAFAPLDAPDKQHLTPLDGARVISSITATLFGYDEFILREVSAESLLAGTPTRR